MKTVLVVDDSEFDRTLLQRLLERRAYRVVCVVSGEDALERLEAGGIDAVLLDGVLPGLQGREVLERVRRTRDRTELPILMISGKTEAPEVMEALRAGANDYVAKPVDFQVLDLRLRAALAVSELTRENAELRAKQSRLEEELALLRRTNQNPE